MQLPPAMYDIELARRAAKKGLFIAPGSLFCIDKSSRLAKGIRVNVSRADDDRFYSFVLSEMA
jgi:DNA-binding transcriptional MocR family regulator